MRYEMGILKQATYDMHIYIYIYIYIYMWYSVLITNYGVRPSGSWGIDRARGNSLMKSYALIPEDPGRVLYTWMADFSCKLVGCKYTMYIHVFAYVIYIRRCKAMTEWRYEFDVSVGCQFRYIIIFRAAWMPLQIYSQPGNVSLFFKHCTLDQQTCEMETPWNSNRKHLHPWDWPSAWLLLY